MIALEEKGTTLVANFVPVNDLFIAILNGVSNFVPVVLFALIVRIIWNFGNGEDFLKVCILIPLILIIYIFSIIYNLIVVSKKLNVSIKYLIELMMRFSLKAGIMCSVIPVYSEIEKALSENLKLKKIIWIFVYQ